MLSTVYNANHQKRERIRWKSILSFSNKTTQQKTIVEERYKCVTNTSHFGPNFSSVVKVQTVWDGLIGQTRAAKHRIEPISILWDKRLYSTVPRRSHRTSVLETRDQQYVGNGCNHTRPNWVGVTNYVCTWEKRKFRFFMNYLKVNVVSDWDSYLITCVDKCMNSLLSPTIFFILNADHGYCPVDDASEDHNKIAWHPIRDCPDSLKWPFRLKNAPRTFHHALDIIVPLVRWPFPIVYFNYIVRLSRSPDEHIRHRRSVLTLLNYAEEKLKSN